MNSGSIKWFNGEKGYGFIIDDDSKEEIFVHFSAIKMDGYKTLNEGEKVTYEVEVDENTGKKRAINVEKQN